MFSVRAALIEETFGSANNKKGVGKLLPTPFFAQSRAIN